MQHELRNLLFEMQIKSIEIITEMFTAVRENQYVIYCVIIGNYIYIQADESKLLWI